MGVRTGTRTVARLVAITLLAAVVLCAVSASASAQPKLKVGVGRADITPPTGYYMMGWVRSDAKVIGQNTRLWARAIVLKRGHRKVALVSEDLNGIPGGMMAGAAQRVPGFSERNVLDSASHTHAAPTGSPPAFDYSTASASRSTWAGSVEVGKQMSSSAPASAKASR